MPLHIVLYQPQIPANTGNIARTCAATNTSLHLIHPLGFQTDDKQLKRAGLDYWSFVDIHYWNSIEEFFETTQSEAYYLVTKFGKQNYSDFDFSDSDKDIYLIFGRETTGLPEWVKEKYSQYAMRIPMSDKDYVRSLNLSNTACMLVYEVLRQQGFKGLH